MTIAPRWRTWLQLLRAPNLFTVPGDPLAGYLLATGGAVSARVALAVAASLCFYGHGLLVNDLADLEEDRRERPARPLPSGAASPRVVLIVAIVLALAALGCCAALGRETLYTGASLLAAVLAYNLWTKKFPVIGPLNMGLCRGLSIWLGAAGHVWTVATPAGSAVIHSELHFLAVMASAGATLYIAAVTNLARVETRADPPKLPRVLPFIALMMIVVSFSFAAFDWVRPMRDANIWLYLVAAYTIYAGAKIHRRLLAPKPPPIPPMIGQLIRLLLPLQAIFCIASRSVAGGITAAVLLVLWPVSRNVSRRFYAS